MDWMKLLHTHTHPPTRFLLFAAPPPPKPEVFAQRTFPVPPSQRLHCYFTKEDLLYSRSNKIRYCCFYILIRDRTLTCSFLLSHHVTTTQCFCAFNGRHVGTTCISHPRSTCVGLWFNSQRIWFQSNSTILATFDHQSQSNGLCQDHRTNPICMPIVLSFQFWHQINTTWMPFPNWFSLNKMHIFATIVIIRQFFSLPPPHYVCYSKFPFFSHTHTHILCHITQCLWRKRIVLLEKKAPSSYSSMVFPHRNHHINTCAFYDISLNSPN